MSAARNRPLNVPIVGAVENEERVMQEVLRTLLRTQPFVPFTIVMSDGTHITVKHPENALLTKHWLYVTTNGGETTEHLYLLHVTRIHKQEQAA